MTENGLMESSQTEKLFYNNSHQKSFEATVLSCQKKENYYEIVLDQTAFFPEGGGQYADTGYLGDAKVLDVQEQEGQILHRTDQELPVGEKVTGQLDWELRFMKMQQHTGEHIVSGIVHERYGYENVGFHLGNEDCTMDFNGEIPVEDLQEIEFRANQAVWENLKIQILYPSKEEEKEMTYRSKIEITGQVRVVIVPGYDACACCAPHVKRTGEIGTLNVQSLSNYKGGVRISILSGFRALEEEQKKSQIISAISGTLSANQELLPQLVEKLKQSNQDLKYKLAQAKQKLIDQKIKEIPAEQENVLLFETDLDTPVMRNAINGLVEAHDGICGIFVEKEDGGYNFIIGSKTKDCREIAALLREKTGARGGGSAAMIQGSVTADEKVLREILI